MHWLGHTVDCTFSRILPCNPKLHYYSHFKDDQEVQRKYATSPRSQLCIVEDLSIIKRIKRKVGFTVNPATSTHHREHSATFVSKYSL